MLKLFLGFCISFILIFFIILNIFRICIVGFKVLFIFCVSFFMILDCFFSGVNVFFIEGRCLWEVCSCLFDWFNWLLMVWDFFKDWYNVDWVVSSFVKLFCEVWVIVFIWLRLGYVIFVFLVFLIFILFFYYYIRVYSFVVFFFIEYMYFLCIKVLFVVYKFIFLLSL